MIHSAMQWKDKWSQKYSEIYIWICPQLLFQQRHVHSAYSFAGVQRKFLAQAISIVAENLDTVIWNALASSLSVCFLLYLLFIKSAYTQSLHDKCSSWFLTKKKSNLCHTNVTPHLALIDFSMHSALDAWQLALDDTSHPGGKQTECSKFCIGCWEQSVVWSLRRNSLTPRLSGRQSCPRWPLQRLATLIDRGWSWL